MYIDADAIIKAAAIVGALSVLGTFLYNGIKWFQAQQKQTRDIEALRKKESEDIQNLKDEQCLLTYGILSCLKGLQEQGCNGPVTQAIDKLEKHLNKQAHGLKG